MTREFSCDAFAEIEWYSYDQALHQSLKEDVHNQTKEYILGVDETEYKKHLVSRFTLEPIEILQETEKVNQPRVEKQRYHDDFGRSGYRDTYIFEVLYSFQGTAALFQVKPGTWTMATHPIRVNPMNSTVGFEITMSKKDAAEFRRIKDEAFGDSFINVGHINDQVRLWNEALPRCVNDLFDHRKKHFSAENDFFAAINLTPN